MKSRSPAFPDEQLGRKDTQDHSHPALIQKTTLTSSREAMVLSLSETFYLPHEDSLYAIK
jgi:hypothetical protein